MNHEVLSETNLNAGTGAMRSSPKLAIVTPNSGFSDQWQASNPAHLQGLKSYTPNGLKKIFYLDQCPPY